MSKASKVYLNTVVLPETKAILRQWAGKGRGRLGMGNVIDRLVAIARKDYTLTLNTKGE